MDEYSNNFKKSYKILSKERLEDKELKYISNMPSVPTDGYKMEALLFSSTGKKLRKKIEYTVLKIDGAWYMSSSSVID